MRFFPLACSSLALLAAVLLAPAPAVALDCREQAGAELRRLEMTADKMRSIRYVEKLNPTNHGPQVLGVRAWVRPTSCPDGYLVIDMTRSCFVRQSYTRGGCRMPGVTAY